MNLKIKSLKEAYALNPETYAVTTNKETIANRPHEAVESIALQDTLSGLPLKKPSYVGYSYCGDIVFTIFADSVTVKYFTNNK